MKRALTLACLLWIAFAARVWGVKEVSTYRQPVPLRMPLDDLPMGVCGPEWVGEDTPLDDEVLARARVSSYVQRSYRRGSANLWFYVGYVARWEPESIHHPAICFPGSGYELILDRKIELSAPGFDKPLRFKEYLWNSPRSGGTYTLTAFYYNGKFEPDDWRLRMDSLAGVKYFAIVTVSGSLLGSVEETRAVYQEVLKRSMPVLVRHFAD